MFESIVVATDGSDGGDQAVRIAEELADEAGSRVLVVHVIELVGGKGGIYPAAADEDDVRRKIDDQITEMRQRGIKAELTVHSTRVGGPAHLISKDADDANADLIVVGSRGMTPLSQVMLGSVPVRLLHIANRPVLVVPADNEPQRSAPPERR